ncbi:MAG: adenine nucleotide alpha hydrolase family protein [Armatimonadetes bacterium]|nr:adenine nucleotide alpha hydrolase family protein [Armatimonadota bacterium]
MCEVQSAAVTCDPASTDWTPEYARRCGVCGSDDSVIPVTEWNRGLCKRCLPRALESHVFAQIRRRSMIHARERIGIAVSGGKDSGALLAVLANLRKRRPFSLVAIHIDMAIAGFSAACRSAVEELCRRYAVRLVTVSVEDLNLRVQATGPWPVCAVCGAIRRAVFPRVARTENLDALATGHTMDDMLQTILKQTMSGRDFCPKPVLPPTAYDPRKIKPLYFTPEKVTAAYVEELGIEHVPDTCPYFPPETHRFKAVFEHLEKLAPMAKMQVLNNLGRLLKPPPATERPFICEDCGEPSRRPLCPLCLIRRLQLGQDVPFLKSHRPGQSSGLD